MDMSTVSSREFPTGRVSEKAIQLAPPGHPHMNMAEEALQKGMIGYQNK